NPDRFTSLEIRGSFSGFVIERDLSDLVQVEAAPLDLIPLLVDDLEIPDSRRVLGGEEYVGLISALQHVEAEAVRPPPDALDGSDVELVDGEPGGVDQGKVLRSGLQQGGT